MNNKKSDKKKTYSGSCETCANNVYDDEYEQYCCMINLDEDEMYRYLNEPNYACPYYKLDDEYAVVRKQN